MDPRYETLVQILDRICDKAPENSEYKMYRPNKKNHVAVNQARVRAYIHLYLWVKFGLTEFTEREPLITEGQFDGGLDAYYIDESNKCIHLIQSKFRANSENFSERSIAADELVKMEIGRITKGMEEDSNGQPFNRHVKEFQAKIRNLHAVALYDWNVVILANLTQFNDEQVSKFIENFKFEVVNFERAYRELVFPVCSATYYNPDTIEIQISLAKKEYPRLKQKINTRFGICDITVVYVPTSEIGRLMLRYKNTILKYNPRNYLSLSKNQVNQAIRESITKLDLNDFAIKNNGITILADRVKDTTITGNEDEGQIILTRPQIINGGQTAYTLSYIYENDYPQNPHVFDDKEVMLKIITLSTAMPSEAPTERVRLDFIDTISDATNRQSRVTEADRRSNSETLVNLQNDIFKTYGYFFERKEGEFFDGRSRKLIDKEFLLDREDLFRAYLAYGGNAASAYSKGEDKLFQEEHFMSVLGSGADFKRIFFAARLHSALEEFEKELRKKKPARNRYGNGLRYGKFAIVCAVGKKKLKLPMTGDEVEQLVQESLKDVLSKWNAFEKYAIKNAKNMDYFRRGDKDFQNYYKGKTINNDLEAFFGT